MACDCFTLLDGHERRVDLVMKRKGNVMVIIKMEVNSPCKDSANGSETGECLYNYVKLSTARSTWGSNRKVVLVLK